MTMLKQLTLFLKVRYHFKLFWFNKLFLYILTNKLGPKHSVKFSLQLDNHPLKKKNTDVVIEDLGPSNVQKLSIEHHELLKRDENYLIHAWNCKDFNCNSEGCAKMKKLIFHSYRCKAGGCRLCKSTFILCYYHVSRCNVNHTCKLPFCPTLGQRMALQIVFNAAINDIGNFSDNCSKEKLQTQLNSVDNNAAGRKRHSMT